MLNKKFHIYRTYVLQNKAVVVSYPQRLLLLCNEDYDIVILQQPLTEEAPGVEDTFKMVLTKCRYQTGNFNNF
jgi:hypothetical protein